MKTDVQGSDPDVPVRAGTTGSDMVNSDMQYKCATTAFGGAWRKGR